MVVGGGLHSTAGLTLPSSKTVSLRKTRKVIVKLEPQAEVNFLEKNIKTLSVPPLQNAAERLRSILLRPSL